MPKIDAKSNKNNFCCWKNAFFRGENAENGISDFSRPCKRLYARGGPSNPQIRDKHAPEIIFNPLIMIITLKFGNFA